MACVGCRTPGESLGDPAKTIQAGIAMSWSVLFLLATVFGVLTLLGFLLVRACRLADASKSPPQP